MKEAPLTFHSNPWLDSIYKAKYDERVDAADKVINSLTSNKEGSKYVDSFLDEKEFVKTQFIPYQYYVPMGKTLENRCAHLKFPSPVIARKHKRLPMIFLMSKMEGFKSDIVPIDYVENYGKDLRQILEYAKPLSYMDQVEKEDLKDILIEGVRSYRGQNSKKDGWFSDYLESNNDFNLLGFSLTHSYINVDKETGDTAPLWVHPWGAPCLFYQHKRQPLFMVTGPCLRLDENVFGQKNMIGFTG